MDQDTKIVYVTCPRCLEIIRMDLGDLVFEGEYVKVVYTHAIFGNKPHSIIIDIDKNYTPQQITLADKTYTKIG